MKYESIADDSKNRSPHKTIHQTFKISFPLSPMFGKHFHTRTNLYISESQAFTSHYILRQERSRDQTFALCVDIRDISSQNYFPFGRNYISITFVPEKIQSTINTSYRFSINTSLKRSGQSNFDDGTTSPTFFVQILTLWNRVSMYLEYGDHKF